MKKLSQWLLLIAMASSLLACGGGSSSDGNNSPSNSLTITGQVVDAAGAVVAGAQVQLGTTAVTTNNEGRFEMNQQQTTSQTQVLRISHPQFLLYAQDYVPVSAGTQARFQLTPYGVTSTFASTSGIQLMVSSATVGIPANALVSANGTEYTGAVTIRANYGNHDTAAGVASFPQPYLGTSDQTQSLLISAGVITVEMRDTQGNLLQLATGSRATLTYPASNTTGSAAEIPMWYYDTSRAIWVREGAAVRQTDGRYVGQVSHFTVWNIDYPVDRTTMVKGCVVDANNQPAASTYAYLVGAGFRASGYTDAKGQFEAYVPNGIDLTLDAFLSNSAALEITALTAGEKRQLTSCLNLKTSSSQTTVTGPVSFLQPIATTRIDPASFLGSASSASGVQALCDSADFPNTLQSRGMILQTTVENLAGNSEFNVDTVAYRYEGRATFQGAERESLRATSYLSGQELGTNTEFFSITSNQFAEYGSTFEGGGATGTRVWNQPRLSPRQLPLGVAINLGSGSYITTYSGINQVSQTTNVLAEQTTLQGYDTLRIGDQSFETCRFMEVTRLVGQLNTAFYARSWVVARGELKGLTIVDESLDETGSVIGRTQVTGYRWIQP